MTLYCRKSLIQFGKANAKYFFEPGKFALKYYSDCFGLDYMFDKCDFVICPEYTIGAMEYPGSVSYSESYLPRSNPPSTDLNGRRARVVSHELAHMWFGDTVSVEWWNDTWLKESFADFIAYECAAQSVTELSYPINNSWVSFLGRKMWGYEEDR